jgi:hypothetical protein
MHTMAQAEFATQSRATQLAELCVPASGAP